MKSNFHHHYKLTKSEVSEIWNSAFFAFDANVLLNFYRYSDTTISNFATVLRSLENRIWLPYQAALEFFERRTEVISAEIKTYDIKVSDLQRLMQEFSKEDRGPFLSAELLQQLSTVVGNVISELETRKKFLEGLFSEDIRLSVVDQLFDGRVGPQMSESELKSIHSEGITRYEKRIPPGFRDKDKPEPERYGDLLLWRQMIKKSESERKPIIFITDDRKDDWWLQVSGKTLGPLPALRAEFSQITNQPFYAYAPFQFLEYASFDLSTDVDKEAIEEVKILPPITRSGNEDQNMIISLTIDTSDPQSNIQAFKDSLTNNGYETHTAQISPQRSWIFITVPNIPDLQRRVHDRFLSDIGKYGLKLVSEATKIVEN